MKISRKWAMPNSNTFSIKPVNELVRRYMEGTVLVADPFANTSKIAHVTNDLDPSVGADYCMDAIDFLKTLETGTVCGVLFDPPYTNRQITEHYTRLGRTVTAKDTQSSYWGNLKTEIARIVKAGGWCITCGWNSGVLALPEGSRSKKFCWCPTAAGITTPLLR